MLRTVPVLLDLLVAQLFLLLEALVGGRVPKAGSMLLLGVHLVLMCVLVILACGLLVLTLVLKRMVSHSRTARGMVEIYHRMVLTTSVQSHKAQP